MIAYEDAAAAIDWLSDAFGFRENEGQRHTDENGVVTHAELDLDGATILRAPQEPGIGFRTYLAEDHEGNRWRFGEKAG